MPNATVMMIENAERFGLAQLRSAPRTGRKGKGPVLLHYGPTVPGMKGAGERLDILNRSNDGFYIASEDLKLRGTQGDILRTASERGYGICAG